MRSQADSPASFRHAVTWVITIFHKQITPHPLHSLRKSAKWQAKRAACRKWSTHSENRGPQPSRRPCSCASKERSTRSLIATVPARSANDQSNQEKILMAQKKVTKKLKQATKVEKTDAPIIFAGGGKQ